RPLNVIALRERTLRLDLADIDRGSRSWRIRCIHLLEHLRRGAQRLLRLEVADEDRRALRLVEEQLDPARLDAGRRPYALDPGEDSRDPLAGDAGESHDTCIHTLLLGSDWLPKSYAHTRELAQITSPRPCSG